MSTTQSDEGIAVANVDSKNRSKWMFIHVLSKMFEWLVVCATIIALYELARWGIDCLWGRLGFESQVWQAPVTVLGLVFCGASVVFLFDARNEWRQRVRQITEREEQRARRAEADKVWEERREDLDTSMKILDLVVDQSMPGGKVPDIN